MWYPCYGSTLFGLIFEILFVSLSLIICQPSSPFDYNLLGIRILRLLSFSLLITLFFASRSRAAFWDSVPASEEHTPLLKQIDYAKEDVEISTTAYGSVVVEPASSRKASSEFDSEQQKHEEKIRKIEKRLQANGNWFTYAREFTIFTTYIWPSGSKHRRLQLNMLGVVICLACIRILNVLVPHQLGIIVNTLAVPRNNLPFVEIVVYIIYRSAAYSAGFPFIKDW